MKKTTIIFAVLLISNLLIFSSCKKDDDKSLPKITMNELGYNNSATVSTGSDLHVEADIEAEAGISQVMIEIHPEFSGTWEFDTTYVKFSGLKNAVFHEHIDIPATADTGEYHFHLVVTDIDGHQTTWEGDIIITLATDATAPMISISLAPANNQTFTTGDTIKIEGLITDETALGGMYIGLVRADQNLNDTLVTDANTITILHTHGFTNPLSHSFSAKIVVGANADNNNPPKDLTSGGWWQHTSYYVLIKGKDAASNWSFSNHYPIILN